MRNRSGVVFGAILCLSHSTANADWVELSNHDFLQGDVISLDAEKLKLKNPNFGELTIPRDRVKIIGFGERPAAPVAAAAPTAAAPRSAVKLSSEIPSLENKQLNQLLQEALGSGGIPELQERINKTKDELKSLQRDLKSTGEGDALDGYIQMFELFGSLIPPDKPAKPKIPQKPAAKSPDKPAATTP